jgi:hypothetical protein
VDAGLERSLTRKTLHAAIRRQQQLRVLSAAGSASPLMMSSCTPPVILYMLNVPYFELLATRAPLVRQPLPSVSKALVTTVMPGSALMNGTISSVLVLASR